MNKKQIKKLKKKIKEYFGLIVFCLTGILLGNSMMSFLMAFTGFRNDWFFTFGTIIFTLIFYFRFKENFYKWWMKFKFGK